MNLLLELRALKAEQALDFAFLAVVDVVRLQSTLLLCGQAEEALASAALCDSPLRAASGSLLDLGARVSRKKDFMPPISAAILKGGPWAQMATAGDGAGAEAFGPVVHECGPKGCILRRMPSITSAAEPISAKVDGYVG